MVSTSSHQQPLPGLDQVPNELLGVFVDHAGANRYRQHQGVAAPTGAVRPLSWRTVLRPIAGLVAVVDQCIERLDGLKIDTAPVATVTPVRPTFLDELFAPETETAPAALARLHANCSFVDEFHADPPTHFRRPDRRLLSAIIYSTAAGLGNPEQKKAPCVHGAFVARCGSVQCGTTLTNLRLLGPLVSNCTLPSAFANRVWSLPKPTLAPA